MLVCIGTHKIPYKSSCIPKPTSSSTTIIKKRKTIPFYDYELPFCAFPGGTVEVFTGVQYFASLLFSAFFSSTCRQLVRENSSNRIELKCSLP